MREACEEKTSLCICICKAWTKQYTLNKTIEYRQQQQWPKKRVEQILSEAHEYAIFSSALCLLSTVSLNMKNGWRISVASQVYYSSIDLMLHTV